MKKLVKALVLILGTSICSSAMAAKPLQITEQGMFSAGGVVVKSEGKFDVSNYYTSRTGSTLHADHANVLFQIPQVAKGLPMMFLHGYGQSRMCWMMTPDGRDGWSNIFLKKGHGVFLVDQPRRGEAGQTSVAGTISTAPQDQTWYTQFRIGTYINDAFTYNDKSKFPRGEAALDQFFRQMTPDTGMDSANGSQSIDNVVVAKAVAAAVDKAYAKTGEKVVLVTHSQGGRPGWLVPMYTKNVAAIVAVEPGRAAEVNSDSYQELVAQKIPVIFYYGDYIGANFKNVPAASMWEKMRSTAYDFQKAYTAQGLKCDVLNLPDLGIYGNDHMLFQDTNNVEIADHLEAWLKKLK
ncbi:MAG: alpha/beta fold hydrolase [Phascolarctobacterium sp.]|nr:alpha/beta fold hydrolase [Phascolarctobacterium sp.]